MSKTNSNNNSIYEEALEMHMTGRPGKIEIISSKPMKTQHDLSMAYTPGVAAPCLKIAENPEDAYKYTAKGNLVAVISNGTAVLGLGNIGALAGKPVMEGKSVLFKTFADVDTIDIEIDSTDLDEIVNCVKLISPTFGGINLEDIKGPDCFYIEEELKKLLNIPVFHDDQHGTAIVATAGLINALEISNRKIEDCKVVINGAGAAAIACASLIKSLGATNITLCDSKGAIYKGRTDGMNKYKEAFAIKTEARTLADAMKNADVFMGVSVKDCVTDDMVRSMADSPIIFAMANPEPEITPERVKAVRSDAICATGRSDYPNQVNNVLGFPFIFRGALDVQATTINEEMKIAAARSLANLAKTEVPEYVKEAYEGAELTFGAEYIIPKPLDLRLIETVAPAVAQAAIDSGVAKKPFTDIESYKAGLRKRVG